MAHYAKAVSARATAQTQNERFARAVTRITLQAIATAAKAGKVPEAHGPWVERLTDRSIARLTALPHSAASIEAEQREAEEKALRGQAPPDDGKGKAREILSACAKLILTRAQAQTQNAELAKKATGIALQALAAAAKAGRLPAEPASWAEKLIDEVIRRLSAPPQQAPVPAVQPPEAEAQAAEASLAEGKTPPPAPEKAEEKAPAAMPQPLQLDVLRVEKKYAVPLADAAIRKGRMSVFLHRDENARQGAYLVRSLYFDTVFNDDYYDKMDGLCDRRKIRLRVYSPHAKTAKLELKEKFGNLQRKRSITVTRAEAARLMAGEYAWLTERREPVAMQLFLLLNEKVYMPKCVVEYDRTAFFVPENDIRITFDENLRASESNLDIFSPALQCLPVFPADASIMEVKYNGFLLSYVKELAEDGRQLPVSASKYTMARGIGGLY